MVALSNLATDQRLHKMAASLQALGYTPTLVGFNLGANTTWPAKSYLQTQFGRLPKRGPLLYLVANYKLLDHLWNDDADVFVANDIDVLPAAWLAAQLRRRKLVLDCHELYTELPSLQQRPFVRWVWQTIEQLLLPRADALITVNHLLANYFKERYGINAHVVYNYPLPQPSQVLPSVQQRLANKILIYQGSLQAGRGLELMLQTMSLLPDCTLWIVGDGPLYDSLRQQAQPLPNVRLWGAVPFADLPAITAQATVGLSLENGDALNLQYATPNKVYDYLAAGLPVVISNLPGLRSQTEPYQAGVVLHQHTPQALAQTVSQLLGDAQAYAALCAGAARAAQHYVWDAQTPVIGAAYAQALTGQR
jgi:glycosyltransferase involved in cell wall biosynthesis